MVDIIHTPPAGNSPKQQIIHISQWFREAVPNPTDRNPFTQTGVHFEAVSDMVQVLGEATTDKLDKDQLVFLSDVLNYMQRQFKGNNLKIDLSIIDRINLLEALCDQIVSAVGVAHMLGMDIEGALGEVAESNDSNCDEDGKLIFNKHRKITKRPRYKSPDLTAFVTRRAHANG